MFEEAVLDYDLLMEALQADFAGHEAIRQMLRRRAPKYGNDDPYVDEIAVWWVNYAAEAVLRYQLPHGGRYVSCMGSNTNNIACGKAVPATPDGRHAGTPISDAASPSYGCDLHGPTAFLCSVARPDYHRVLTGSVINMKFDPTLFADLDAPTWFSALTHMFVRERIPELQFNFNGNALLREALDHPETHENLVVRVSGFSAYFVRLAPEVQQDILRRRAHGM